MRSKPERCTWVDHDVIRRWIGSIKKYSSPQLWCFCNSIWRSDMYTNHSLEPIHLCKKSVYIRYIDMTCPFIGLTSWCFLTLLWAPANLGPESPGFVDIKKPTELLVCIRPYEAISMFETVSTKSIVSARNSKLGQGVDVRVLIVCSILGWVVLPIITDESTFQKNSCW